MKTAVGGHIRGTVIYALRPATQRTLYPRHALASKAVCHADYINPAILGIQVLSRLHAEDIPKAGHPQLTRRLDPPLHEGRTYTCVADRPVWIVLQICCSNKLSVY